MATPKTYVRPATLSEAFELAGQPNAIAFAGGALTLGKLDLPYETVVDVQDVPELCRAEMSDQGATFGAALPLQTVLEWVSLPLVLKRSLSRDLTLNFRDGMTIGESLRQWQTPMLREWITALLAHDAGIEYVGANGELAWDNTIAFLEAGRFDREFITAINLPALREGQALGAAHIARTPADVPIVNAAAFLYVDADRRVGSEFVFVGGASTQPIMQVRLTTLIDSPLDEANIASAVKAVAPQVDPMDDYLGSADYRREMARVVVQRALLECLGQLG